MVRFVHCNKFHSFNHCAFCIVIRGVSVAQPSKCDLRTNLLEQWEVSRSLSCKSRIDDFNGVLSH